MWGLAVCLRPQPLALGSSERDAVTGHKHPLLSWDTSQVTVLSGSLRNSLQPAVLCDWASSSQLLSSPFRGHHRPAKIFKDIHMGWHAVVQAVLAALYPKHSRHYSAGMVVETNSAGLLPLVKLGASCGAPPLRRERRETPTGTGTACMVARAPSQPSHSLLLLSAFSRMFLWATAGLSKGLGARWSLGCLQKSKQPWSPSTTLQRWTQSLGNSAVPPEISPSL